MSAGHFIQPKLTGYRQLNEREAALMNRIKALGEELRQVVADVELHQRETVSELVGEALLEFHRAEPAAWLDRGKVGAQSSLMALTRAVARPTHF